MATKAKIAKAKRKPKFSSRQERRCQPVRCDVGRDVRPVEAAGGEGRVLQPRREGMRDRVPDQRDELAHLYP